MDYTSGIMTIRLEELPEFTQWLEALRDVSARQRIALRLLRVEGGNLGDVKPVGEGVSELRIDYGPGYRLYLKRVGRRLIVMLCGGDKSTQSRDIDRALELAKQLEN